MANCPVTSHTTNARNSPICKKSLPKTNLPLNIISQAVMKEALRIHPAVAFPPERYVLADGATICGYRLPVGINVSVNPAGDSYGQDVFGKDADKFRAGRWLDASPYLLMRMDRSFIAVGL